MIDQTCELPIWRCVDIPLKLYHLKGWGEKSGCEEFSMWNLANFDTESTHPKKSDWEVEGKYLLMNEFQSWWCTYHVRTHSWLSFTCCCSPLDPSSIWECKIRTLIKNSNNTTSQFYVQVHYWILLVWFVLRNGFWRRKWYSLCTTEKIYIPTGIIHFLHQNEKCCKMSS